MPQLNERSARAVERLRAYGTPETNYWKVPLKKRAAVLYLLFADKHGELRVIITIRSSALTSFPGHAALPGGRADFETETPFQTARREANEEIGLPDINDPLPSPFSIEHLCEFPCAVSVTDVAVRPCVAFLHSYNEKTGEDADAEEAFMPRLDAKEVAAVFSARLHNFLMMEDEVFDETERKELPGSPQDWYHGFWAEHNGPYRMHNFYVPIANQRITKSRRLSVSSTEESNKKLTPEQLATEADRVRLWGESCMGESRYRVWGLTARLLVDAAKIAFNEEPQFEYNKKHGEEHVLLDFLASGRFEKVMAKH